MDGLSLGENGIFHGLPSTPAITDLRRRTKRDPIYRGLRNVFISMLVCLIWWGIGSYIKRDRAMAWMDMLGSVRLETRPKIYVSEALKMVERGCHTWPDLCDGEAAL